MIINNQTGWKAIRQDMDIVESVSRFNMKMHHVAHTAVLNKGLLWERAIAVVK